MYPYSPDHGPMGRGHGPGRGGPLARPEALLAARDGADRNPGMMKA